MIVFLVGFWSVEDLVGKVILEVSACRPSLASMRHECSRQSILEHKFTVFLIVLEIQNRAWPFFPTTLKLLTYTLCWRRILLSSSDKFSAPSCKSRNNNDMWLRLKLSLRMITSMLEWQVQCFSMQVQKQQQYVIKNHAGPVRPALKRQVQCWGDTSSGPTCKSRNKINMSLRAKLGRRRMKRGPENIQQRWTCRSAALGVDLFMNFLEISNSEVRTHS